MCNWCRDIHPGCSSDVGDFDVTLNETKALDATDMEKSLAQVVHGFD